MRDICYLIMLALIALLCIVREIITHKKLGTTSTQASSNVTKTLDLATIAAFAISVIFSFIYFGFDFRVSGLAAILLVLILLHIGNHVKRQAQEHGYTRSRIMLMRVL